MNIYLVNEKIKVVADGPAGAIYLAHKKYKIDITAKVKMIIADYEKGFRPRVIN